MRRSRVPCICRFQTPVLHKTFTSLALAEKVKKKYSASITLDNFASGQTSPLLLCQFSVFTEQSVFADKDSGAARACDSAGGDHSGKLLIVGRQPAGRSAAVLWRKQLQAGHRGQM